MTAPTGPDPLSGSRRRVLDDGAGGTQERRERADGGLEHPFRAVKAQHSATRTSMQRAADRLTHAASSPVFLVVHAVWFAFWILANTGVLGRRIFDPYPFGLLTLILSVEAIFLTIFVLMTQGRESVIAELREELTLQVILHIESEVTKSLQLITGLYARLGMPVGNEPELRDMLRPLDPTIIQRELEQQIGEGVSPGADEKVEEEAAGGGSTGGEGRDTDGDEADGERSGGERSARNAGGG
ncbi:MAG: DUF1003 domain-containing protein [Gemmatimonadaceae bacterium]